MVILNEIQFANSFLYVFHYIFQIGKTQEINRNTEKTLFSSVIIISNQKFKDSNLFIQLFLIMLYPVVS